ncbi:hypothetical protein [Flavobacterium chungangense]|uniref:Uncharacterized protein n=1 Tax=Flavobacterium chungangense TaxID=554283 RepID=A0A6V6Z9P5_9FLAO|nr:hypothetical protein [Flavobacterium chungangense]CAD0008501.1 hypothetical protein FLACHUCJ7_03808 [Flavobacterium chungangense]
MKKVIKSKISFLFITAVLLLSCKKSDGNSGEYSNEADSTQTTVDSVAPLPADSVNSDLENGERSGANGAGTTGATGEGSTGSGSAGTTQKGNTSVRTDSTSTGK